MAWFLDNVHTQSAQCMPPWPALVAVKDAKSPNKPFVAPNKKWSRAQKFEMILPILGCQCPISSFSFLSGACVVSDAVNFVQNLAECCSRSAHAVCKQLQSIAGQQLHEPYFWPFPTSCRVFTPFASHGCLHGLHSLYCLRAMVLTERTISPAHQFVLAKEGNRDC